MNLKDKVYLITGGSSGLGKAMAIGLIKEGAKIVITGRDKEKLDHVAKEIGATPFHADVASDKDVNALYAFVDSNFSQLDGLINNAGIGDWAAIDELDKEKMRAVFEVNVFGAAMIASQAAKRFKKQNYGDIVNIASTASQKGFKMGTIYAASKFALRGMSQCWQAELRPFNVRVIQINPSEVPTAFSAEDRIERDLAPNKLTPKEIADVTIASLKMDRRGFIPEVSVFATNPF
ncbi:SDR family NAD(P)-dependent oxidoreductase [Crocinitomix sp.]|nr:SDR family NAD(P)-dependent oxidoreductase [Crocinitomix sp.]